MAAQRQSGESVIPTPIGLQVSGMRAASQPASDLPTSAPVPVQGTQRLAQWMMIPWVDRALAILAVAPFVYPIVVHLKHYLRYGELVYLAEILLLIGTMVSRRTAVRVSLRPAYFVLACVASYWGLFLLSVKDPGRQLIHPLLIAPIYLVSVFIVFWGRISLGRNISMVPAQRHLVDDGAYRWMRHPIYTAYFLSMLGGILESYSHRNVWLYGLGIFWFVLRTLAEEDFLRADPSYTAYMRRVPWRWFPGVL
jgi:protein-S-isoprenylcysteine O-methyltransferase Ste14